MHANPLLAGVMPEQSIEMISSDKPAQLEHLFTQPFVESLPRIQRTLSTAVPGVDSDDLFLESCTRELSRQTPTGTQVIDKTSIFQRSTHGKLLKIGTLFNPKHPRVKYTIRLIAFLGYIHSYYTAFDVAFGPTRESLALLLIDQIVNVMFIAETIFQYKTAIYLASSDVFIADQTFIKRRFTSLKMLPRALHIIPFELLHFSLVPSAMSYQGAIGLRLLRLTKVIRLKQLFIPSENASIEYNERKRWFMLLDIFARFVCVSHLIACLLYGLSQIDSGSDASLSYFGRMCTNWGLEPDCHASQPTLWLYVVCLYYAVTITTTIGFGNIYPYTTVQLLAHILFIIIGALHNAIIIAKVVETVAEFSRLQRDYGAALSKLNDFTETRHIPDDLRRELKRHFDYQWSRTRCIDEQSFLEGTPHALRFKVAHTLYFATMKRVKMFENTPEPFLVSLLMHSTSEYYRKKEIVYSVGYEATCIFVVLKGVLQEYQDEMLKQATCTFSKAECFGLEIFSKKAENKIRTSVVRAETSSDLLRIEYNVIVNASQLYEQLFEKVQLQAINQLNVQLHIST